MKATVQITTIRLDGDAIEAASVVGQAIASSSVSAEQAALDADLDAAIVAACDDVVDEVIDVSGYVGWESVRQAIRAKRTALRARETSPPDDEALG